MREQVESLLDLSVLANPEAGNQSNAFLVTMPGGWRVFMMIM